MVPDKTQMLQFVNRYLPDFEAHSDFEELSGGNLNLILRVRGKNGNVILKHSPPYIASSPNIPMNSNRLMFEAGALEAFLPGGRLSEICSEQVRPPDFLGYDKENSLLLMEDVSPAIQWFEVIQSGESGPESAISLGQFIGRLHSKTYSNTFFADRFNNQPVQETRFRVQYKLLSEKLAARNDDISRLAAERCKELGRILLQPGKCLLMGDLWPPSLLWSTNNKIRIIDWEFAHYGRPLQDLAHFCAHCIMHQVVALPQQRELYFDIWKNMFEGYRKATDRLFTELMDSEEKQWFPVHTGAEILARTIGAFSEGYLFAGKKENGNSGKLTDAAIHLIAGNQTETFLPYLRLLDD